VAAEVRIAIVGDARRFKSAIGDVEKSVSGIGGKVKGALAGLGFAAAGRKVLGFADEFKNLAIEVENFSKQTGIAAEDASRWLEVAGDLGIGSDVVSKSMGKLALNLGKGEDKLKALGLQVIRTKDGVIRMDGTFAKALKLLKGIEDPAERAKVGMKLFGQTWRDLVPLIDSSKQLDVLLDEVGDAQVIDQKEIDKAKKLRDAQDQLNDALGSVKLTIGQAIIPLLVTFSGWLGNLDGKTIRMIGVLIGGAGFVVALGKVATGIKAVSGMFTLLATNPYVAILAAIAGAAILIWKNWDILRDKFKAVIDAVIGWLKKLWGWIEKILDGLGLIDKKNVIPAVKLGPQAEAYVAAQGAAAAAALGVKPGESYAGPTLGASVVSNIVNNIYTQGGIPDVVQLGRAQERAQRQSLAAQGKRTVKR
jgi:hypothetical protein